MKKNILVMTMVLSLLLVSCGKKVVENTENISTWETKNIEVKEEVKEIKKVEENTDEKVNTTMSEILKKGTPTTCTFKMKAENEQVYDAILYVEWKSMRYVMNWTIEWNKIENNMLLKYGFSYSWTNMTKQWFKMKQNLDENADKSNPKKQLKEMNESIDFDCKKWVDSAIFELPKDISFEEFDMSKIPNIPNTKN